MARRFLFLAALVAIAASQDSGAQESATDSSASIPEDAATLVVAGGCFWCVEKDFEARDDVYEAVSGYGGGTTPNPTYENHASHREVVKVYYDASATTYEELVTWFLRTIDPTDAGGQFCDRGFSYSTAIHFTTDEEQRAAETAVAEAAEILDAPIATVVSTLPFFVEAEGYHQDYYQKNPVRYNLYRTSCGRDRRIERLWGSLVTKQ